ncbi:M10 family metallopeptidase [Aestuariivirga sp.]|uniref:M10 family metallopeptidase n=1 Tax=Aestuariivirga sp. TaxID=2650926 RepID=UPI003593310B
MAFSNPVSTASSGNTLLNGVLWGSQWSDGSPATTSLAVCIAGLGGSQQFDFGGRAVTARTTGEEAAAFRQAMAMIESVCNIDFVEVSALSNADLVFGITGPGPLDGALGEAVPPGEDVGAIANQQGAVIVNRAGYASDGYGSLQVGGYDFITFIHEIGHAIGLKHPHDRGSGAFPKFPGVSGPFGDYGDFNLNQGINTMMSYNDGFPEGPLGRKNPLRIPDHGWNTVMAIDIAALQYLYGANTSHNTGDDTYVLPGRNLAGNYYSCIWDAGGIDTIAAGRNVASTINLNAASLRVAADGGGLVSSQNGVLGGYTIASGVLIENAAGAGGNDTLTGNRATNVLSGLGGSDVIAGGRGGDTLSGGGGGDTFRFNSVTDSRGRASDVITDFTGIDVIDLSRIDADGTGLRDSFDFIETDSFGNLRGELRYEYDSKTDVTKLLGDVDGNGIADFTVRLAGNIVFAADDFIL